MIWENEEHAKSAQSGHAHKKNWMKPHVHIVLVPLQPLKTEQAPHLTHMPQTQVVQQMDCNHTTGQIA